MEQRLKERLTGAAILVALIVLIVPELFHGHLAERGKASNSSEGPPMRSYLIDLGGAHSAPMQLGATSAEPPAAPAPGSSAPAPAPIAPSSRAALALPTPAPRATGSAAHHASAPARVLRASSPSVSHGRGSADWSVQLGLYAKRSNAEHMVHVAQAKGFTASLTKPDTKGRYRVRVAGLSTRSAALTLAARLRAAGLPAAAVGPR